MIVREVLDNGVRLDHRDAWTTCGRSSVGVWLTRGSRHEPAEPSGIAHFVEHMLFKGTEHALGRGHRAGRSTGSAATWTPSPSKEYAGYYIKVLDEHLPLARRHPVRPRAQPGLRRRRHRAREEGDPRRDQDGRGHARRSGPRAVHAELLGAATRSAGRFSAAARRVEALTPAVAPGVSSTTPTSRRTSSSSPSGNIDARAVARAGRAEPSARSARAGRARQRAAARRGAAGRRCATKDLEQSHVCLGHEQLSAESRRPVRELRAQHRAWRLDELAPVPERPREARAGLRRLQQPGRLPRRRHAHGLRRLRRTRPSAKSSTSSSTSCAA